MTFTIPVWVLWLVGIPVALIALFLMVMGALLIYTMSKRD